ncbi:MAG TPA: sigma-70 family RNA polymerase sigma factor [Ramlibacter sp.]|nr:sigma-70 family RNA polymerase sigma factor [Ramlibacter sp.]
MADSSDDVRAQIAALLPRLRRFGRALARTQEDDDDVVQIAIEKALMRTGQWTPGTRLDSWMFRIMQNVWIDEVRARERRGRIFVPEEEAQHVGASPTDAQIDAIAVRKAVAQLNDDQRAVVGLVLVEGLAYQEAAEVLGIPVGTLTSRLARARDALQRLLGETAANTKEGAA